MNFLIPLVPTIVFMILCVVPLSTIIFILKKQIGCKKYPINMELLRGPGHSLQMKIEELTIDILVKALILPLIPITLYSIYATQVALSQKNIGSTVLFMYLLGATLFILSLSRDAYKMIKERTLLRLGYECKIAVGQELSQLAPFGYRVFHDFPAENFHIDHIAIGPQGVFAIETKGRAKTTKQENDNWKLQFDGQKLIFPGWIEDKPVKQAKAQSAWLSKWLENATGEKHKVTPVVAIPGWWIDGVPSGDLRIFNGKKPTFLTKGPVVLDEKHIESIAFHIDKHCRDGETTAYNV
ncbi:MAG: NERD domain-containing protein [Proteobacteria bacterium]|nr:NERD domain-containing protein [Pseudomonadota bacterium]MBU1641071.1 NERD domain-containing protein [Pseudomonadota bacterium]